MIELYDGMLLYHGSYIGIPYEEALLRFTSSRVYNALFDYSTEIWKESSDYLLDLYDYCNSKKSA